MPWITTKFINICILYFFLFYELGADICQSLIVIVSIASAEHVSAEMVAASVSDSCFGKRKSLQLPEIILTRNRDKNMQLMNMNSQHILFSINIYA